MDGKLKVPYVAIGAYAAFVVVSTLLVGILPPLVNKPQCKEEKAVFQPAIPNLDDFRHDIEPIQHRERRDLISEQRPNLNERIQKFSQKYPGKLEEVYRKHSAKSLKQKDDGYNICKEIIDPEPGVLYPWYRERLPDNIVPDNYDIEIFVPQWGLSVYDGFNEITVNITSSTQYILVHANLEVPLLQSIKDKNNNEIPVNCVGDFYYFKNDYFIIKLDKFVQPSDGPIKILFLFIAELPQYDSGIFEFQFGQSGSESTMLASKFEPIDARKAYPCFDEPRFKATYQIKIDHPKDTIALSNTPPERDIPIPTLNNSLETIFVKTPPMPTYLMAYVVFNAKDFEKVSATTVGDIMINVWARRELVEEGYADDTLNLTVNIYSALLDIFRNVNEAALPPKIDLFAIPEYPINAVPHFGLPIFRENEILFKYESVSERDLQRIGLLVAKQLAEFWFGNFVTFSWWDELWLQEALGDYIKYRAVDEAYPQWNVLDQFISEELIYALVDDAYPSSHPVYKNISSPYEIEEYFDEVETTKAAAIFRMVEEELNINTMYEALTAYLNAHPWGNAEVYYLYDKLYKVDKWEAKDFFDRWTKQANYPLLNIQIMNDQNSNQQMIKVVQSRALNSESSIFSADLLYPSPYNWVWYVPLTCSFGTGPSNDDTVIEQDFFIDTKEFTAVIRNSLNNKYKWVHCDRKFSGYFATDYTPENWENLGEALRQQNFEFSPLDRANIIHNLFVNAFTERSSYVQLVDVLAYLNREKDYLPWRTVYKHVNDMASILDYKKSFYQVSTYFSSLMRKIENDMDLWNPSGSHIEELMKETIVDLACRLQDSYCLKKSSELWAVAAPALLSGNYNQTILPPYVREVVFNYHIQNTYDVNEWDFILMEFETLNDLAERRRLLESLTYTRLPWLLIRLLEQLRADRLEKIDLFDVTRLMGRNPIGREIAWDYFRINFREISEEFGEDDPRLGQMLIDIVSTFETEFLFFELLEFVFFTNTGATANARFRALELASTNYIWLIEKEEEIIEAFGDSRMKAELKQTLAKIDNKFLESRKDLNSFKLKAKETLSNHLSKSNLGGVFDKLKKYF